MAGLPVTNIFLDKILNDNGYIGRLFVLGSVSVIVPVILAGKYSDKNREKAIKISGLFQIISNILKIYIIFNNKLKYFKEFFIVITLLYRISNTTKKVSLQSIFSDSIKGNNKRDELESYLK